MLFVSPVEVDNPVDGLRWRAHLTARGLARVADVEVLEVTTDSERSGAGVVVAPRTPVRRLTSRVHPVLPARVASRDWSPARRRLAAADRADLIWVMQPDLVGAGVPLPAGPVVVDFVDLEDGKYVDGRWSQRHQRRAWSALQRSVIDRADSVVLAHPGEAASLTHRRVTVLPNAVDVQPVDPDDGSATLTLVGRFTYQPNLEAARWMVDEVLPLLRQQHGDVRLLLVGRHDGALDSMDQIDGVESVGFVDDLEPVWRRTTAMVAPIRTGTGTRIKIIEAFARGVPVVSTTLGCDGLGAEPDRHLLVADTPTAFADACLRVLDDDDLRRRLRNAALAHVRLRHAAEDFESIVATVATDLMGSIG